MSDRPRDTDLIQIPTSTLHGMRDVLLRQKGALEAAALLRDIGLASGDAMFELLRQSLAAGGRDGAPEDIPFDEFWPQLSEFFDSLGWGTLEHEQIADGVLSITVRRWAEADRSGAGSYFTAGVLAGILHRLAGTNLAVLEVGADLEPGTARFIVGSPDTLEAVFLHMQDGSGYAEAVATVSGGNEAN